MTNFLVKDKSFYTKVLAIAIPMALQNLINVGVSLLDTVMLGQLGEVAMSASSLAGQVGFTYMIMNLGLTAGASVLTSQYWGRGDSASIRKVLSMTYKISMILAAIFTAAALLIPTQLMTIFTKETDVIASGAVYIRIMAFSYFISGFTMTSFSILRTVGTVKISLYVYIISFFVNVFFNYSLIFGHFGMPAMGIAGAALATLIARAVEFVIVVIFIFKYDHKIQFTVKDFLLKTDVEILKIYMKHGAPVLCNEILWSLGSSMLSVIMGHMGKEFVAANSICSVVFQCTSVMTQGMSSAASVLAGNTIGEGKYKQAREQSLTVFVISIVLGVIACGITVAVSKPFVSFYNVSDETRAIAFELLAVMAVLTIFQTVGGINMFGTLRGGGDSKFVLFFDVSSMWLFSVPLGWLSGLVLHWPVWAVCICLRSGDVFKSFGAIARILSGKWVKDVTRSEKQIEAIESQ
ncbi:MAG: MATE family efflux transporter [Oscillospiraceae bacterium]|nr:MATE family efflux transporter [Oscillospiraceae bacterium]